MYWELHFCAHYNLITLLLFKRWEVTGKSGESCDVDSVVRKPWWRCNVWPQENAFGGISKLVCNAYCGTPRTIYVIYHYLHICLAFCQILNLATLGDKVLYDKYACTLDLIYANKFKNDICRIFTFHILIIIT